MGELGTKPPPGAAPRVGLFPSSECFAEGDPSDRGFYALEMPDGFRWIQKEANCGLPLPRGRRFLRPAIVVRTMAHRFPWTPQLTVLVNGHFAGTQLIARYGDYYFELDGRLLQDASALAVGLVVNHYEFMKESNGERLLSLPIYDVRCVDLDDLGHADEERGLLLEQLAIFREDRSILPEVLRPLHLDASSMILEVGAGMGHASVLVAAQTGARVIAIDVEHYDDAGVAGFKHGLIQRFSRHFSALQNDPCFQRVRSMQEVETAIKTKCSFIGMDAENMIFKDGLFDFVFSLNAFEHIPHPDRAAREIARVLRPGGHACLLFHPLYFCDGGHHLHACHLLDKPWIHLLEDRERIKARVRAGGRPDNEVDRILDSLNGWSPGQFRTAFAQSGLRVIQQSSSRGFTIPGAESSNEFQQLQMKYSIEDLTTIGMMVHLHKPEA